MMSCYPTIFAILATLALWADALPLNINLGAYSPALVVGDGEISFAGGSDVNSLMAALEGAAVETASRVATEDTGTLPVEGADVQNKEREEAKDIANLLGGQENAIEPRKVDIIPAKVAPAAKRDLAGFDRALTYAEAALVKGPKVQLGTGHEGSGIGIIVDNNQVAAARPGRGTEGEGEAGGEVVPEAPVAPAPVVPEAIVPTTPVIAGETQPTQAPTKREVEPQKRQIQRRTKMTTMYIRSGISEEASLSGKHAARQLTREIATKRDSADTVVSKRDNLDTAFDSVNLNVPAEGATVTFVEEVEEDEE